MVCLIEKHYLKELKEYAKILGSEDAAYYVLACNNGYTLDRNQNGDPSSLFTALLEDNGGDEADAIIRKSSAFSTPFVKDHGEWYETEKEPSIKDIEGYEPCDNTCIEELFPGSSVKLNYALEENLTDRSATISFILNDAINEVRKKSVRILQENTPDRELTPKETWQAKHDASIVFDTVKFKQSISKCIEQLCILWDIKIDIDPETGEWYAVSNNNDATTNIRIHFINSLRDSKWKDKKGIVHRGVFMEETGPDALMHTILISLEDGNAGTLVHELAHSYIRMFWNSLLIQDALKYVAKPGMSNVEIEEALVEKMVEQVVSDTVKSTELIEKQFDQRGYFEKVKDLYKNIGKQADITFVQREQNEITSKDANKRFWKEFWNNLTDLIRAVLGRPLKYNKNIQQNVLDSITAAFLLKQDLSFERAKELYMDKPSPIMYENTLEEVEDQTNKTDKLAMSEIRSSLRSRISSEKAQIHRDEKLIERLEVWYNNIEGRDPRIANDFERTVREVIQAAWEDIEFVKLKFANIELGLEKLEPKEFYRLKTDILGFYSAILNGPVYNLFFQSKVTSISKDSDIAKAVILLTSEIKQLENQFNVYNRQYVDSIIDQWIDENVTIGDKELIRQNTKMWARSQIDNGDLMPMEVWLAPAVVSKSPVIRAVDYMTRTINQEVRQETLKVGHRLVSLYENAKRFGNDLNPRNYFRHFIELDDKGMPTGYFVRPENYGLMRKQYNKTVEKLMKKIPGVTRDEDGVLLYKDRDAYLKFNEALDKKLEDLHIHRRYKAEYYIERRKKLSEEAITRLNDIQRQIDVILQKAIDPKTGIPVVGQLDKRYRDQYMRLKKQKADLGSIYEVRTDDNGNIISFKKKEGEALEIAQLILNWHGWLKDKVKYSPNKDKFKQDRQKLIDAYGEDSLIVKQFDQSYSVYSLTPEFYSDLEKAMGKRKYDPQLADLYERRSNILNLVKDPGFSQPHLERLNDEALAELKSIDEEIDKLSGNNSETISTGFNRVATKNYVMAYDAVGNLTTDTYLTKIWNLYESMKAIDPTAAEEFRKKYIYVDKHGNEKFLSIFKYTSPKTNENIETGELYKDYLPTDRYKEIDPESELLDPEYDPSVPEYMQPDKKYHHNKLYDWLMKDKNKDAKALYEAFIETMLTAYRMLDKFDEGNAYRLPQISDSNVRMIFKNPFNGFISLQGVSKWVSNFGTITERDIDYAEDYIRRPDGSEVRTVPIRWVRHLENPETVSTDLIQTVSMFFQMAMNYKEKSEFAPLTEMIHLVTSTTQSGVVNKTEQSERLNKYIDMYVYERRKTGFKGKSLSKSEKFVSKSIQNALNIAHGKLMQHNFFSVLKNGWDSLIHIWTEAIVGKYFRVQELIKAGLICDFQQLRHNTLGKANSLNKVTAAMTHAGVTGSIGEIFKGLRSSWIRRVLSKHLGMGEFSLVDYHFKGRVTVAAYLSCKLITDPSTGKERFVNKDEARYIYTLAGLGANEGYKAWKKSKTSLWDAYSVDKDGNFVLKNEYEDIVRPYISELQRRSKRVETQIEGVIRERSAVINGMIDEYDRNGMSTNYLGAAFLLMRGWLVTSSWDHFKVGYDFAKYDEYEPAKLGKEKKWFRKYLYKHNIDFENYDLTYKGLFNAATGYIEYGNWLSLHKTVYKSLRLLLSVGRNEKFARTLEERRQMRRLECALGGLILTCMLVYFFGKLAMNAALGGGDDDNPESTFWQFLYTVSVAATSERFGDIPILNMISFTDLIKSPFVASTLLQDFEAFPNLIVDIVSGDLFTYLGYKLGWSDDASAYNDLETVKGGNYRGDKSTERDLFKVLSYFGLNAHNIKRDFSKASYRQIENFYRSLTGVDFIAPKADFKTNNGYKDRYPWEFWVSEENNIDYGNSKSDKNKQKNKRTR